MDRDFNIKEGHWFPVANEIAEKLITYELTKVEYRVLWMFLRYCWGKNKSTCELRHKDMLEITGLGRGSLSKAINRLKSRQILKSFQTETKTTVTYKINSKISTWKDKVSIRKQFPNVNQKVSKRELNSSQTETPTLYKDNKTNKDKSVSVKNKKGNGVELPDWLDTDTWKELKKYRKAKFTPHAQKLAISKLTELRKQGNDPTAVINQTILRGWSGLFPVKDNGDRAPFDIEKEKQRLSTELAAKRLEKFKEML